MEKKKACNVTSTSLAIKLTTESTASVFSICTPMQESTQSAKKKAANAVSKRNKA